MRVRYLPVENISVGMVLNEAVSDRFNRVFLPVGTVLDKERIAQLDTHSIRFVCVVSPDLRLAEDIAVDAAAACHRVLEIFDYADLTDSTMAQLFNQILTYRCA